MTTHAHAPTTSLARPLHPHLPQLVACPLLAIAAVALFVAASLVAAPSPLLALLLLLLSFAAAASAIVVALWPLPSVTDTEEPK